MHSLVQRKLMVVLHSFIYSFSRMQLMSYYGVSISS